MRFKGGTMPRGKVETVLLVIAALPGFGMLAVGLIYQSWWGWVLVGVGGIWSLWVLVFVSLALVKVDRLLESELLERRTLNGERRR